MKIFKIFVVILFINNVNGNDVECTLTNGDPGFCVPLKDCAMTRSSNFVFYPDQFCLDDFSLICCDSPVASSINRIVASSFQSYEEHPNYNLFDLEKCGELSVRRRIAHGAYAAVLEFPWAALIGYKVNNDVIFLCGGTLISVNYVLTASHCILKKNKELKNAVSVRLGEHTKSTTRDCYKEDGEIVYCADPVQDIPIDSSDIIVHSEFNYLTMKNDIALIRLKESAKVNQNNIKQICLPFDSMKEHKQLTVIGFGATHTSGSANSDVLMKVNVNLKENHECTTQLELKSFRHLDDTQICAGDSHDSCEGDSGSSLEGYDKIGRNKTSKKVQYGIVSFGCKCGSSEPGVYTKVQKYLFWILDNVKVSE